MRKGWKGWKDNQVMVASQGQGGPAEPVWIGNGECGAVPAVELSPSGARMSGVPLANPASLASRRLSLSFERNASTQIDVVSRPPA